MSLFFVPIFPIFQYYYDVESRLTNVNDASTNAHIARYDYDYSGRRIKKTVYGSPDVVTKYVYDGDQIIAEYDGSGTLVKKYIYGPGIDEPVCMIAGSNTYYYHFDGLGSVTALTNSSGAAVETYRYSVFGFPWIYNANGLDVGGESSYGNSFMFTGRQWDAESKLYYYRARMYSPYIGRFLQPDPIGYYDSMNLYQYCGNNPTNWIDPWGLWTEEAHQHLGRYGGGGTNDRFDYARLDRDHPATGSSADRARHFREIGPTYRDAMDAARRGDARDFEYHMHELQDYYAHTAAGYGPKWGHWYNPYAPDDPQRPENRGRYDQADRATRQLEDEWDGFRNSEAETHEGSDGDSDKNCTGR